MRCITCLALVLLAIHPTTYAKSDEKPVGKSYFVQKSDGTLQPVYPVRLRIEREKGKTQEHAGSLSCEIRARERKAGDVTVIQTVLRCDDGATYVVTGVIYQGDAR